MQLPTVKIKAKNETGYIVINEDDFDQKKQKLYSEPVKTIAEKEEIIPPESKPKKKRDRPPSDKKENPFE